MATVRALKYHGGVAKEELKQENTSAVSKGLVNLETHIDNLQQHFKANVVVAINKFAADTEDEIKPIIELCSKMNVEVSLSEGWEKGGEGTTDLAQKVMNAVSNAPAGEPKYLYDSSEMSISEKIEALAGYYGADGVTYSDKALESINTIERIGKSNLPVCVAKTQYSLSDNPKLLGSPKGFKINVRDVKLSNGAGFVVALCGKILRMPGLPSVPSANSIDVDKEGNIIGLF